MSSRVRLFIFENVIVTGGVGRYEQPRAFVYLLNKSFVSSKAGLYG